MVTCPDCGKELKNQGGLNLHKATKHPMPKIADDVTIDVGPSEVIDVDALEAEPGNVIQLLPEVESNMQRRLRESSTGGLGVVTPGLVTGDAMAAAARERALQNRMAAAALEPNPTGEYLTDRQRERAMARAAERSADPVVTFVTLDQAVQIPVEEIMSNWATDVAPEVTPTTGQQATSGEPSGAGSTGIAERADSGATRKRLNHVRFRCHEGYPDPQDSIWLLKVVDRADAILKLLAQPHVYTEWEQGLSE